MACQNYKNQVVIDRIIRSANERLRRIDEASGIKNPKPFYEEGTMPCDECADGGNPDFMAELFNKVQDGDSDFHRLCYTPQK